MTVGVNVICVPEHAPSLLKLKSTVGGIALEVKLCKPKTVTGNDLFNPKKVMINKKNKRVRKDVLFM